MIDDAKRRYFVGPYEDPNEPPKVLMTADTAADCLRSYLTEGDAGDVLQFRIVELTDADIEALPEL